MRILGVDEAGRGCVIGPMVVGGVVVDSIGLERLGSLEVKDSKKLSPKRRLELAAGVEGIISEFELRRVEPPQIDKVSLNQLDLDEIVFLIRKFSPRRVYFDVPTHPWGVGGFIASVRERIEMGKIRPFQNVCEDGSSHCELVGENRADSKYSVVAAASILAKVERDRIISELREEYGDFGSGYPSDPKTQRFLREWFGEHGDFPPMVRRKWATVQRVLREPPLF